MSEWSITVGDADFAEAVLARSRKVPVIVDFWAPWCGPCRTLGPMVEKLAQEYGGRFVLAKVNVDDNPGLARQYQVQSIPRLIAFNDGKPALDAVGALPAADLRRFIDRVVPTPAEEAARAGDAALANGDEVEALRLFDAAVALDSHNARGLIGLAQMRAKSDELEDALALLDRVLATDPLRQVAERLAATVRLRAGGSADLDELQRRVTENPGESQSRFELAQALAAQSRYQEALDHFLEIVGRDRGFQDGAARKAMLDIFEALGGEADLVRHYRDELAKVLFS